MSTASRRTRPIVRMMLFGATLAVVVPIMRGMISGAIPSGPIRLLLLTTLFGVVALGVLTARRHHALKAATRRTTELLRFFDDISMLRPRAQAARALIAGAPANDLERRALTAVCQFLGELATSVVEGTPEGRSAVLAHPIVGAWYRALAVTPIPVSFDATQRKALSQLFVDVGAPRSRSEPLDEGSRALLERDAVMFRTEETDARIF
jgi:hypothetical protein